MYFRFDRGSAEAERLCGSLALAARLELNGSAAAESVAHDVFSVRQGLRGS
jgi:hypothetical protein